jgi:glutaredoxin-like YruB-family protein
MTITIYSTPTCPYCHEAKKFFTEQQMPFTDIDVTQDPEAAEEMMQKSGRAGVPVMVIKKDDGQEQVIVGFDKKALTEAVT